MNKAQLINQDSGNYEYYTPSWIIELARETMGSINLDPASSLKANEIVKAFHFYNDHTNGLRLSWFDNVWMNHPFSKQNNPVWIKRFIAEYRVGNMKQGCCITYASTSEKWFQPLMDYTQCYFHKRVNYIDGLTGIEKKGVTKGSVVTYLGPNVDRFYKVFSPYGKVMVSYASTKK